MPTLMSCAATWGTKAKRTIDTAAVSARNVFKAACWCFVLRWCMNGHIHHASDETKPHNVVSGYHTPPRGVRRVCFRRQTDAQRRYQTHHLRLPVWVIRVVAHRRKLRGAEFADIAGLTSSEQRPPKLIVCSTSMSGHLVESSVSRALQRGETRML